MTQIQIEQSLAKWAVTLEISASTLANWAYALGASAPFDNQTMIAVLSYGKGAAENAKGATKPNADINLQKIERALQWL